VAAESESSSDENSERTPKCPICMHRIMKVRLRGYS
jgi:hypothetical protein